ncbi:MAG: hypothetical protein QF917_01450 [Candidatus Woesearchaeota archaeon]|jgi:hypothetical protein|nr:hypothetical protein [Candidatus Woesearchaeota archaeon]|tara:strand:+ start:19724 stop:19852 length:129 start_codon:yes stop_codon:yes gene_type:complete
MQKKLNKFIRKEMEKFKDIKYIEGITFEQLKKISKEDNYYIN